ncbi:mRNA decay activator protein ZFP36L1-like [Limulus polyphemus]|uniref:mRNA decay activator protein ZFP36L1-like n=1 Tax=Limulus polyphemus TaxID=6850 RepID=A0ABM1BL96_LIMPO|nr:mRNA decay activator protein ZFP36L1-like [Limulus polyphemus]
MSTALVPCCEWNDTFSKNNVSAHKRSFPLDRRPLISPPLNVAGSRRSSASAASNVIPPTSKSVLTFQKSINGVGMHQPISSPVDNVSCGPKEHRRLDRSFSEPATKPTQANSSRYKTELCRPFEENGTCKYGDKCQFAHGAQELRTLARHPKYKTELCRTFHTTGLCPYGPRCHFIHNSEELRKHMLNNLHAGLNPLQYPEGPSEQPRAGLGASRPKTLSLGSFSLGSTGEMSPPSSLSASPTSLNSFFPDDNFGTFFSTHHAPGSTHRSASFPFCQDFALLMSPVKQQPCLSTFGGSQPSLNPFIISTLGGDMAGENPVCSDPLYSPVHAPPSPANSLNSELDNLSSAFDINHNLPRLPIFSKLSVFDSD